MRTKIQGSIFGKQLDIIKDDLDDMLVIIQCPNCGQPTKYGDTRMCSGFIGCDNLLPDGRECYFDDLLPRVLDMRENDNENYTKGTNVYLKDIEEE